jgi:hypothetical protein
MNDPQNYTELDTLIDSIISDIENGDIVDRNVLEQYADEAPELQR